MALHELPVRLAIRREGDVVKAYLAKKDSMEGAMLLATLNEKMAQNEELFRAWKDVMIRAVEIMVENTFDETPEMIERPAPGEERQQ
jgi:hypothetical protein